MSNCTDCNYLSTALHRQMTCSKCRQTASAVTRPTQVQPTQAHSNGTVELTVKVPKQVPAYVQSTQAQPTQVQPTQVQSTQVQHTQAQPTQVQSTQVQSTRPAHASAQASAQSAQVPITTKIMDVVSNNACRLDNIGEDTMYLSAEMVGMCGRVDRLESRVDRLEGHASEQTNMIIKLSADVTSLTIQNAHMSALLTAIAGHIGVTEDEVGEALSEMQKGSPVKPPTDRGTASARETLCESEHHGPDCHSATIRTLPGGRKACIACIARNNEIQKTKGRK